MLQGRIKRTAEKGNKPKTPQLLFNTCYPPSSNKYSLIGRCYRASCCVLWVSLRTALKCCGPRDFSEAPTVYVNSRLALINTKTYTLLNAGGTSLYV